MEPPVSEPSAPIAIPAATATAEPPAAWTSLVKEGRTHVLPARLSAEQLAAQVARIALIEEEARLDKRLAKVSKRRRQVNRRLAA